MPKRLKFVVEQSVLCWYDGKRGRRGDSKFSNRSVTFEWNRDVRFESNLEASQVPIYKRGLSRRAVSVCLCVSVCLSICHIRAFCQNE